MDALQLQNMQRLGMLQQGYPQPVNMEQYAPPERSPNDLTRKITTQDFLTIGTFGKKKKSITNKKCGKKKPVSKKPRKKSGKKK